MTTVVLASGSPRRHELLAQLGVTFTVRIPDVDESTRVGESPIDYVRRLALTKARAVDAAEDVVIAADTTVELDGEILAKPVDADDARRMLRRLSSRTHRVHTGVAVLHDDHVAAEVCTTMVTFADLDPATIDWYVSTGEPMDKAGAYAVQGAGAALVKVVRGSVTNVVGLPLHLVAELTARCGVPLVAPASTT